MTTCLASTVLAQEITLAEHLADLLVWLIPVLIFAAGTFGLWYLLRKTSRGILQAPHRWWQITKTVMSVLALLVWLVCWVALVGSYDMMTCPKPDVYTVDQIQNDPAILERVTFIRAGVQLDLVSENISFVCADCDNTVRAQDHRLVTTSQEGVRLAIARCNQTYHLYTNRSAYIQALLNDTLC